MQAWIIGIMASLLVLILAIAGGSYINRCQQPEQLRLVVVRSCFWFLMVCLVVYLLAGAVALAMGNYPPSVLSALLPLSSLAFGTAGVGVFLQIVRERSQLGRMPTRKDLDVDHFQLRQRKLWHIAGRMMVLLALLQCENMAVNHYVRQRNIAEREYKQVIFNSQHDAIQRSLASIQRAIASETESRESIQAAIQSTNRSIEALKRSIASK